MELFILTFIFIGLAALGMAVGVLFRGAELQGTCATLGGGVHGSMTCGICPVRQGRDRGEGQPCPRREIAGQDTEFAAARARQP